MTLVEKAHGDRNFRQRESRLNQHLLGALDSLLYEEDMRGSANTGAPEQLKLMCLDLKCWLL